MFPSKLCHSGIVAVIAEHFAVGNALHKNPDPEHIPCYRVVNSKGELSGAFAFGGADEQANRLRADGIAVINNRVDLVKYGMKL